MSFLEIRISQIIESYLQDSLPENIVNMYSKCSSKEDREKLINRVIKKKGARYEVDMSKSSEVSELPELLTSIKASELSS